MKKAHRSVLAGVVAVAAAASLSPVPAAADAAVQVTGGSLTPAFDESVIDYTVRCETPLTMHVDAPAGTEISMDGDPFRSGAFDTPVPLSQNEAFAWVMGRAGQETTYHARCLPADFPSYSVQRNGEPQAQWYVVAPNFISGTPPSSTYVVLFDNHGVPVWWTSADGIDAKLLPDGHLAWAPSGYEEHDFNSVDPVRTWSTVGVQPDQHDMQLLPNGDALLVAYPHRTGVDVSKFKPGDTDAEVIDAEIQEVTPDGRLVWDWNSKDHIRLGETDPTWWQRFGGPPYDLVHINSVENDGDGIIFSGRHLDAIYRIDKASGNVDWKLGGVTTSKSLTVTNDPLGGHPLAGQHDARRLADRTVSVHDNGTDENRPPRAVRYAIDPVGRTASLVESVADPQIVSSMCCGSARKLSVPNGDWVMSWGGNPVVEEMTPQGQRVLALTFAGGRFSYRADPILPGRVQADTLRAGMDTLHPRPPAEVQVAVDGPVTAGTPFAVTARVLDAGGNVAAGYDGGGAWSDVTGQLSPAEPADFVHGVSSTTATIPVARDADRIRITTGGLSGESVAFAVVAPPSPAALPAGGGSASTGSDQVPMMPSGPAARPLAIAFPRRDRRIRVGLHGRFAFVLGAQDVDATGRIRFTATAPSRVVGRASKQLVLSSKRFRSTAGRATTVRVRLTPRQRRVLAAARRLSAIAALTAQDRAGTVVRRSYRFELLAPRNRS